MRATSKKDSRTIWSILLRPLFVAATMVRNVCSHIHINELIATLDGRLQGARRNDAAAISKRKNNTSKRIAKGKQRESKMPE